MQENSALHDDEMGVAGVSSHLYANVTKYHAQIGANVDRETLQQLEWNLLGEAKVLFHQRKFEEALNTFTHCLAVTEKTRSAQDHAVRGAVIHNIASCLHNLGEMEAAQAYYDQAIEAFKKAKTPLFERWFYGDANRRRIDFVKERLVDITWGRKPDGDKYLDENGVKRPVPEGGAPGEGGALSGGMDGLSTTWREDGPPPLPSWMANPESDGPPRGGHGGGYGGGGGYGPGGRGGYDDREVPVHPYMLEREPPRASSAQYLSGAPAASSLVDLGGNSGGGGGGGGYTVGGAGGSGGGGSGEPVADAEQEAARKEWLQYHMQVGEWDAAAELVVTREEKDDLEYLMQRQERLGDESEAPPVRGAARGGAARLEQQDEEDGML